MSSLRSRRAPSERRPDRGMTYRRRKRGRPEDKGANGNETLSKVGLAVVFTCVCMFLGYREYKRVQQRRAPKLYPNVDRLESLISPEEDAALEIHSDHTRYHVVFSTDCSPYQHWQSYLVYYSAFKVRQPGHVTRIASGCTEEESVAIKEWFNTHVQHMSWRFHLHLTPHFSEIKSEDTGDIIGDYKFFNKPFGLKHWMENADSSHFNLSQQDDIIILIDPDMVLLRPLVGDFTDERETVVSPRRKKHMLGTRVDHGLPFAQTYGLGTQWRTFDLDKIAGENSPAKQVSQQDASLYYPVGPPYIATVRDMYRIAEKWTEFVPRVHAQYPHLLAEMFAFCIAAAHLDLKHQLIDSLMVSATELDAGEGWPLVDKIPAATMCEFAAHPQHDKYAVPSVVHLCQRYAVGDEWFFGKHRVPHDIYSCEHPLLIEPPSNLALLYDYKKPPNQKLPKALSKIKVARETFMVCFLTSLLNEAASFYKQSACPEGTANLGKTIKMTDLFSEKERQG